MCSSRIASGRLVAGAPTYLKTHSSANMCSTTAWAEAYERAGGRYYPKMLVPRRSRRSPGAGCWSRADAPTARADADGAACATSARRPAPRRSMSISCDRRRRRCSTAKGLGRAHRRAVPFLQRGYADFDDFLAALASRKRKSDQARAARRRSATTSRSTAHRRRDEVEHWDAFFAFYMDTGSRKWGRPYLTRAFFSTASARPWRTACCW